MVSTPVFLVAALVLVLAALPKDRSRQRRDALSAYETATWGDPTQYAKQYAAGRAPSPVQLRRMQNPDEPEHQFAQVDARGNLAPAPLPHEMLRV